MNQVPIDNFVDRNTDRCGIVAPSDLAATIRRVDDLGDRVGKRRRISRIEVLAAKSFFFFFFFFFFDDVDEIADFWKNGGAAVRLSPGAEPRSFLLCSCTGRPQPRWR